MCEMSEERTYYIRTSLMYTDLTREVLFKVFKYLINSDDITGFLSSVEQQHKLRELLKRHVLNQPDYNLVSSQVLNLERFDISLLVRLILNLCKDNIPKPQRGWETKPNPRDESLGADLLRLRDVRNKIIGHRADAKLSEAEYEKTWAKIKAILLRVVELVDSQSSENFEQRINGYKRLNVDTENVVVKKLLDELQSYKTEFDHLQEKVEELSRRSKEFEEYFKTTPEIFVRYIKLLFDGGRIVLCGIMKTKLGDQDLSGFLERHKETLNRNIDEKFSWCLYPQESCPDYKMWDLFLLASVLLLTFDNDLSQKEIMYIERIKSARVNYAALALQSLDTVDFLTNWIDLINCLNQLSINIAEDDKLQVEYLIERFKKKDENACDAEEYFKQLRESGVELKTLNDVYNETIKELRDMLNQLSQKDFKFEKGFVFEFKLLTICENEEIKKEAEDLLEINLQASIQISDQPSGSIRKETDKVVAIIAAHPDVIPLEVKRKCIIWSFKCSTPGGLIHLLDATEGDQFKSAFRNIAYEMHYIYGYAFLIQGKYTLESVSMVSRMIHKSTTNEASSEHVSISLKCSSVDGISSVLSAIKWGKTTNSLERIAEQMSAEFNETVSINLLPDLMEFGNVFEETGEKDFKTHLQVAIETQNTLTGEENTQVLQKNDRIFIEELQDQNVYINDSVVLRCKLDTPVGDNVEWRKDCKLIKITDNIVFMNNHCTHWLAITQASVEDTGKYSCVCGHISTSADLTVIDEALSVVIDLPIKSEVIENGNIDIECKVNLLTSKPVWRHKGKILESSDRYVILAKGTTHKLTVMNVTFQEEGEYTVDFGKVSSKTTLIVQGDKEVLHRKQLIEKLYRNWVRGALALKYLKVGLEAFSDKAVKSQHDDIVSALKGACNSCTEKTLIPHKQDQCPRQNKHLCLCSINTKNKKHKSTKMCPNGGYCGKFYDRIAWDHRFQDPLLANTDIQKWNSDPWSVATCFINTSGYKDKQSAKDVDCSGLLSLCINNIYIEMLLGEVITDPFAQAREARNDILHNPNYELSENQLNKYIKTFKEVLEIKDKYGNTPLKGEPGVEEALHLLDMVQQNQIEINLEYEVRQLREHGMLTLEKNYQTAKEQHELKLQLIEQQIKDKENELRLMQNLRSAGTQKDPKEHFLLDLQIKVIAKNVEKSADGNQKVYEVMRDYFQKKYDKTGSPFDVRSTDTPVYHLLDYIKTIEKCHIVDISLTNQSSTDIQINCLSSVAMEDFLKSINSIEFEQELFKLRRWLYVQYDVETHVIIANCSSKGIEKANKQLHFTGVTRNMTCAKHQNTQCTLYCPDHDTFFCTACRESKHSTCNGIKQLMTERFCVEQRRQLNLKREQRSYNVRINYTLINRGSNDKFPECYIYSMCMLPNGEVLLADRWNKRLKKLNGSYKVISYCDVTAHPFSVCYIGNDTAVASLGEDTIQYVNVSGNITLRQLVNLDHKCYGLACLGDILYVHSGDTIYKYDKDKCEQKYVLYQLSENLSIPYTRINAIAISDNGERVYFKTKTGLTTIDAEGNHKFSSHHSDIFDTCIAGESIVLVLDKTNCLHQLDYNGKKHQTVDLNSIPSPKSLCFDRERCRLIVGGKDDMIYVYKCEILPS